MRNSGWPNKPHPQLQEVKWERQAMNWLPSARFCERKKISSAIPACFETACPGGPGRNRNPRASPNAGQGSITLSCPSTNGIPHPQMQPVIQSERSEPNGPPLRFQRRAPTSPPSALPGGSIGLSGPSRITAYESGLYGPRKTHSGGRPGIYPRYHANRMSGGFSH